MARCRAVVDKHFEGYWTLQFIEAGQVTLRSGRQTHTLGPGTFWCCCPGPRIFFTTSVSGASWNHRYVAVRGERPQTWAAEELFFRVPVIVPASRKPEFAARMDDLIHLFRSGEERATRRGANLLENLLLELLEIGEGGITSPLAAQVLEHLVASNYGPIDYTDFARQRHCSAPTLRRRFFEETGQPIHRFVQRARIDRVKRLLIETEQTIKQVAALSGFSDVFYLSRQFKLWTGLSPARFRETRAV